MARIPLTLALILTACTGGQPPAATPETPETPAVNESKTIDHGEAHDAAAFSPLPEAKVEFLAPANGDTVTSPVTIKMGVTGAEVKPAGALVAGTGHHHIIVDSEKVPAGTAVPSDPNHIHFGDGSTETQLELEPGEHTLMLQFADGMHRSYGEGASATIKVTVQE